jgi:hypothetical protein
MPCFFFEGGEVLRTRRKLFLERPMITIDGQRLPQIIAGGLLVLMAMLGALIDSLAPF